MTPAISNAEAQTRLIAMAFGHDKQLGDMGRMLHMMCEPVFTLDDASQLVDAIGDYNDFRTERVKQSLRDAFATGHVKAIHMGRSSSPIMFVELETAFDSSVEQRRQVQEDIADMFDADERDLVSGPGFYGRHVCSLMRDLSHYTDEAQERVRAEQDSCERNPFDRTIRLWWD